MKSVLLIGVVILFFSVPKGNLSQTQTRDQAREQEQNQSRAQIRNQTQAQTEGTKQQQTMTQPKLSQHDLKDTDGDGICDRCGNPIGSGKANAQGKLAKKGKHWGPGDGTGNKGARPQDGTGYGTQSGSQSSPSFANGQGGGAQSSPGHGSRGGHGPKR